MMCPTDLETLVLGAGDRRVVTIANVWGVDPALVHQVKPDTLSLYGLIDDLGAEERWTLFDILDHGGIAAARTYPRRIDGQGRRIPFDENAILDAGLCFIVAQGPALERYFVVADELLEGIRDYRAQLLLMHFSAVIEAFEKHGEKAQPILLPEQIKPAFALSHLLATSDPEGFRFPLSRALNIPDSFPASIKRALKSLLHEFYLLLIPSLSLLRRDRRYPIQVLIKLAGVVSAMISHEYTMMLDPELCHEDTRPFESANTLLGGARDAFWRSFLVLFLDGFLSPIGATKSDSTTFQVVEPRALAKIDTEIKPSEWLQDTLVDLGITG